MKQSRVVPFVHSVVMLGLVSTGLTRNAFAQTSKSEEPPSSTTNSSSYSSSSLTAALFSPMLPDAPGLTSQPTSTTPLVKTHKVETSLSVGGFPQLTATRIENVPSGGFLTQSLHPSAGVLATFRQSFRPWLGYSVNMGYTRASIHNTNNAGAAPVGTFANYYVPNNIWELSVTHVAQTHLTHKLTGFTEAGAGFLAFQPAKKGSTYLVPSGLCCTRVDTSFRPLIVFGAGADYHFNSEWALRAEYRGQLYKYPDYGVAPTKLITVTSEPTVSLTYTFGGKKKRYKQ